MDGASGLPGAVFGFGGPGDNEASRATLKRIAAEQDRAAAVQRDKLASPAAKEERERSKAAHDDLTDVGALDLLRREFSGELRAPVPDAETLIGGDRVAGFLSDYVARVEGLDGRPDRLIDSQVPLRAAEAQSATKTPVDLDLVREGDSYAADNGPVEVKLGAELDQGVQLGPVRVTPAGDGQASTLDSDTLAYPNVVTDTDVAVNLTPTGFETYHQLRSPKSPEVQRLQLDLPAGASLQAAEGGGAEILAGGQRKVAISPPVAVDAQGQAVAASYDIEGDDLLVVVAHRSKPLAYPILLDPEFVVKEDWACSGGANCTSTWFHNSPYALSGLQHWSWYSSYGATQPPYGKDTYNGSKRCLRGYGLDNCYGPAYGGGTNWNPGPNYQSVGETGLHVNVRPNTWYLAGSIGEWIYAPPGTSTQIYRADFGAKFLRMRTANTNIRMFTGIYSYPYGNWAAATTYFGSEDGTYDGNLTHRWEDASIGTSQPGPQVAAFGFTNLAGGADYVGQWRDGYMGAAIIQLTDPEPPTMTDANNVMSGTTGWTKDATWTFTPTATDPGLGVRRLRLSAPMTTGGPAIADRVHGCTGVKASPCPATFTASGASAFTVKAAGGTGAINSQPLPDGEVTVTTTASDALAGAGHDTARTKVVKVDRSAPQIAASAKLWEARNGTEDRRNEGIYDATAPLHVTADDGDASSSATRRSGVKSIEVFVDGASKKKDTYACAADTQCNFHEELDYTLDVEALVQARGDGDIPIRVEAKDLAGNPVATKEWTVTVDRRGDVYHGKRYLDGVAGAGPPSVEEWSTLDEKTARQETEGELTTMVPITCQPASLGSTCLDWRSVSYTLDEEPRTAETFSRQTFASSDPNAERVAIMTSVLDGTKTGEGPIASVAEPWQTLPPAHSSEYELYESSFPGESNGGETVNRKQYLDKETKLPIYARVADAEGLTVGEYRWTYGQSRKQVGEYPAGHFKVERPSTVTADTEIDARPAATAGPVHDTETNSTFSSMIAGLSPSVGSLSMCLTASATVRQYDSDPGDEFSSNDPPAAEDHPPLVEGPNIPPFPEDPPEEPPVEGEVADLTPDPYGPETWVDTVYRSLPSGVSCLVGGDKLPEDSPLTIRTLRQTSSLALSARNHHSEVGEAVQLDPDHDDFAFSGKLSLTLPGGQITSAYLVRIDEDESSALIDIGEVTLILSGKFTKEQLPALANLLEVAS